MTMGEKQILTRAIEIQKENWGVTTHFLEINKQQLFWKAVKYQAMYDVFLHIEALLSMKNAWFPPILDTKITC